MGMQVDIYRTEKCLKGIEHGMTKKELVEYSGYGIKTVKAIQENPERYKILLEKAKAKKNEEYIPAYAEMFAYEWNRATSQIKKACGWK